LEVRLFHPEDSLAVAEALVSMLDALVDRLSEQQQNEMLAYVNGEYAQAERRLKIEEEGRAGPREEAVLLPIHRGSLTAVLPWHRKARIAFQQERLGDVLRLIGQHLLKADHIRLVL
ncbi:MAG: hypothetical protein AAFR79_15975, partial [Pseudomonadota bacterium]